MSHKIRLKISLLTRNICAMHVTPAKTKNIIDQKKAASIKSCPVRVKVYQIKCINIDH